jgi:hypothetical protein
MHRSEKRRQMRLVLTIAALGGSNFMPPRERHSQSLPSSARPLQ